MDGEPEILKDSNRLKLLLITAKGKEREKLLEELKENEKELERLNQ